MATSIVFNSKVKNKKRADSFPCGTVVSCDGDGIQNIVMIVKTEEHCVWGFDLENNELYDLPPNMKVTELDTKITILGETSYSKEGGE